MEVEEMGKNIYISLFYSVFYRLPEKVTTNGFGGTTDLI